MQRIIAQFSLLLTLVAATSAWSQNAPANLPRRFWTIWPAAQFDAFPKFVLHARYADRTAYPLPATVDNSKKPFAAPLTRWVAQGYSCGNSAAGVVYSYEVQKTLNLPSTGTSPLFTYEFTYHQLNGGDQGEGGDSYMTAEAFDIYKVMGIPTSADFGGFEWGNSFGGWMSGYDKYYRAMKNRAEDYGKIDASTDAGQVLVKQYLHDQGDLSADGGLLNFQACDQYVKGTVGGRPVYNSMVKCRNHAMVILGYDDAFNGGSFLVFDDYGYSGWMPYSFFKTGGPLAGTFGTTFMYCKMKKNYSPKVTLKISLTHNQRENISIRTGVANSASAVAPTQVKTYGLAFNYSGGLYPMVGKGQGATLEIGLDLTDFLTAPVAKVFLQVLSKGGVGQINSVTLMDYAGATVKEIPAVESNVAIAAGTATAPATTLVGIPWIGTVGVRDAGARIAAPGGSILAYRHGGPVRLRLGGAASTEATLHIRDLRGLPVYGSRLRLDAASPEAVFLWGLKSQRGESVPPGLYFASLKLSKGGKTIKTLVTKIHLVD